MTDRPALTRSDVRAWTEERFYERGRRYFEQGRIQHPRRQGPTLKAECQGSRPAPYRLQATLDAAGIVSADCSCPVGAGGRCKHVVALLLTWIDDPEAFTTVASIKTALKQRSKDQLIALIEKMIDRHPDLETLVMLSAGAASSLDANQLQQQIERVLAGATTGYDYDPYHAALEVARELEPFLTLGADYADQDRLADAVTVYQLVTEAVLDRYDAFADEEGELNHAVNTCVEQLGDLLGRVDDADLRMRILRLLFDVYRWDVDYGGIGMGDEAPDVILNHVTPAERRQVADWVRDALPDIQTTREEWAFNLMTGERITWDRNAWHRRRLGGFLLDLEADTLDDEAYLNVCRQTGRLDDLVDRLLALGRRDEALDAVRDASDYDLYRLADRFVEHGAATAIRDLVQDRIAASQSPDRRLVGWLRDYAETHDDSETALALSKQLFWDARSPEAYQSVRRHAQALNRWDDEQTAILDRLRETEQFNLLTRLHLANGDVEAALHTVHQKDKWYGPPQGLKLEVARAAESSHPDAAVDLYLEAACDLIDQRGRSNYAQAAEHLARIKQIYLNRNDTAAWTDLIDMIRDDNSNLPALQDELDKAGL